MRIQWCEALLNYLWESNHRTLWYYWLRIYTPIMFSNRIHNLQDLYKRLKTDYSPYLLIY